MKRDPEIRPILDELNHAPEHVRKWALAHLDQYKSDALARPNEARVTVLQALMKSRLGELLKAWKENRI